MVKFSSSLDASHVEFITNQSLFYVASAPWAGDHINVSPKGHPSRTLAILGPTTIAYLDATGSGCETIAHIYENGRVTLMFSSSGTKPQVLRVFCKGKVVEKWDPYYQQLRARMATENGDDIDITGARAIIVLRVKKVQTSCGFRVSSSSDSVGEDAVTIVAHDHHVDAQADALSHRDTIDDWARKQIEKQELGDFQKRWNHRSLDGLPGMMSARRSHDENIAIEDTKAWLRKIWKQQDAVAFGIGLGILFMLLLSLVGVLSIKALFLEHFLNWQRRQMGMPEDHSWRKSEL
ncbi:hypothetical protein J1614_008951 [Plenodomus biglobosus]|nr:hypothetical protein J1614_008951 [Plenodomus biglobosus]